MKKDLEVLRKAVEALKKVSEVAQAPSWKKTWSDFTPDEQQKIFEMFSKTYQKATGEAWDEHFFRGRARNWVFYGNEHGFVAARPQKSGMLKIVGSAGHPAAVDKGMRHVLQEERPVWAAATPELANGMIKHYGLRSVSPMLVKQMAPLLADQGVLGDGEIKHIQDDGTIHLSYANLKNVVQKKIVGNDLYHKKIAPAMIAAAPMQAYDTAKDFVNKINPFKKSEEIEPLEKASKNQLLQMLGADPKAKEIVHWLTTEVPRDDIQQWFVRNYRQNPSIWNQENKETISHYVGMIKVSPNSDLEKIRLDKTHSLQDGLNLWKNAEQKVLSETSKSRLISPDNNTQKMIDLGDGWGWYRLNRSNCAEEGKAMGHCGNAGSPSKGDHILSLRREKNVLGRVFHEPHLTFIENNGYIGESKGRNNTKPDPRYHKAIVELMKHPSIKENIGGGYRPSNNFYLNDLNPELLSHLLQAKPTIERLFNSKSGDVNPDEYPEKHHKEAWRHNKGLDEMRKGTYGLHAALFRDADPLKAKKALSDAISSMPTGLETDKILKSPHLDASHVDQALNEKSDYMTRAALLMSHAANSDHVNKGLGDWHEEVRSAAVHSPGFGPEHMPRVLADDSPWVRKQAVESRHFKPQHMETALQDESWDVIRAAMSSDHFGPQHIPILLQHPDDYIRQLGIESPHFGPQHMDQALRSDDWDVVRTAAESPHLAKHHISVLLQHPDEKVRLAAVKSPHFGPEHINKALEDSDSDVRYFAINSSHFGPEHIDRAILDPDYFVREHARETPYFNSNHVSKLLQNPNKAIRAEAAASLMFGPEHMQTALADADPNVRYLATKSRHFRPEHVASALKDKESKVRVLAVRSTAFGPEHMTLAMNDPDPSVRQEAVRSSHFGPQHIDQAMSDPDSSVRVQAVSSPHFGPHHIDQAMKDDAPSVRAKAAETPYFSGKHMDAALKDPDFRVRYHAVMSPHFGPQHVAQAKEDPDPNIRYALKKLGHD